MVCSSQEYRDPEKPPAMRRAVPDANGHLVFCLSQSCMSAISVTCAAGRMRADDNGPHPKSGMTSLWHSKVRLPRI